MNSDEIINLILLELYQASLNDNNYFNLQDLCNKIECKEVTFWNLVDALKDDFFIQATSFGKYCITAHGKQKIESLGLIPKDDVNANEKARNLIIESLLRIHEEKGHLYGLSIYELLEVTQLDETLLKGNLVHLISLNHIEKYGNACFRITRLGLKVADKLRSQKNFIEEFETISKMLPQPRGRALQKFLAKLLEQHGWGQEEGVTTSFEEMDVIIFREREYYLLECKWEKYPIEAKIVREIFGKLGNRIDVRGVIVSMSGFTSGAIEQVEKYIGQKVVLLFGKQDIESMVYENNSFDNLLNQKYKELVMRGKVVYE